MKNNKINLEKVVLSFGIVFLIAKCAPPKEREKLTLLEKKTINMEDTIPNGKKIEGDAHGGKFYSRADSLIYGCGINYLIPDSLVQKDLRVKLNAWVRIGDLSKDKKFAVSLENASNQSINWGEIDFRKHVAETNKWVNVIDSVTIPGNLISTNGLLIKTFSFNPNGDSYLDVDDVELYFYKVEKVLEN